MILIDRGLELQIVYPRIATGETIRCFQACLLEFRSLHLLLFGFQWTQRKPKGYAPLAQLVEQLTLNQWVRGSSPRRCTTVTARRREAEAGSQCYFAEGPPVPIPNTEVKLC